MKSQTTSGESQKIGGDQNTQEDAVSIKPNVVCVDIPVVGAGETPHPSLPIPLAVGRRYYDYIDNLVMLTAEQKATLKANLIRYQDTGDGVKELVFRDTPEVRSVLMLPEEPEPRR